MSRQALRFMMLGLLMVVMLGAMAAVTLNSATLTYAQTDDIAVTPVLSDEALITIAKNVLYSQLAHDAITVVNTQRVTYGQWWAAWDIPNRLEPGFDPDLPIFIVVFHAPSPPQRVPGAFGGPIRFDVDGQYGGAAVMLAHTGEIIRRMDYEIRDVPIRLFDPDMLSEDALYQIALEAAVKADYTSNNIQRESSAWMRRGVWADHQQLLLTDEQARLQLVYAVALSRQNAGDNGLTLIMNSVDGSIVGCRHRYIDLDWRASGIYPPLQPNPMVYATPTLDLTPTLSLDSPTAAPSTAALSTTEKRSEQALIEEWGAKMFGDPANYRVLQARQTTVAEFMGIVSLIRVLQPPEWTPDTPLLVVAYRGSVPAGRSNYPDETACGLAESEGYDASVAINMVTGNSFMQTSSGGINPLPNRMFPEPLLERSQLIEIARAAARERGVQGNILRQSYAWMYWELWQFDRRGRPPSPEDAIDAFRPIFVMSLSDAPEGETGLTLVLDVGTGEVLDFDPAYINIDWSKDNFYPPRLNRDNSTPIPPEITPEVTAESSQTP